MALTLEQLIGKRFLGEARAADDGTWAEQLLAQGSESMNVAILAGLGLDKYPDSEEVELYFQKSLQDLGLILPDESQGLKSYAQYVCKQITEEKMAIAAGVEILSSFYSVSDYEPLYGIWDELAEDLWMVNNGEPTIFNSGINAENKETYIKAVAAQFIVLLQQDLPPNFFNLAVCKKCHRLGEYQWETLKPKRLVASLCQTLGKQQPTYRSVCGNCGEPYPYGMGDYEGRRLYLEIMGQAKKL